MLKQCLIIGGVSVLMTACATKSTSVTHANPAYGQQLVLKKNKTALGPHKDLLAVRQYYFDCKSTVFPDKYYAAAREQVDYLNKHPKAIMQLQGFDAAAGSANYSLVVAQERADAVKNFMRLQGVNPAQVFSVSYGSEVSAPYSGKVHASDCRVDLIYLSDPGMSGMIKEFIR